MIVKKFFMDNLTQSYGHVTERMKDESANRMEQYIKGIQKA